ncbi:MAG: hypothetical protein VXY90_14065, partial [Pseudomonadota bacterium]|nr:hypothetical protein [Pseudomonadota bacterium]MEC8585891.1 hypothetical protein [Pseudomonadota bacterium]
MTTTMWRSTRGSMRSGALSQSDEPSAPAPRTAALCRPRPPRRPRASLRSCRRSSPPSKKPSTAWIGPQVAATMPEVDVPNAASAAVAAPPAGSPTKRSILEVGEEGEGLKGLLVSLLTL